MASVMVLLALVLLLAGCCEAMPNGPPILACPMMEPNHPPHAAQTTPSPVDVTILPADITTYDTDTILFGKQIDGNKLLQKARQLGSWISSLSACPLILVFLIISSHPSLSCSEVYCAGNPNIQGIHGASKTSE